ncbi:MAG: alpha-amylase family glycosyl hydrolase, partial [Ilumatobacteraceae bacterium]
SFYFFDEHPDEYVAWFGIRSLPKFDLSSPELRRRLVAGKESVVAHWLQPPYELDGWRIDVANMTGRHGKHDVNQDVARDIRATMADVGADLWLVAEHCHDATADLDGDGWHGTMAYNWFTRPVWCWLRGDDPPGLLGFPSPPPRLGGREVASSMRLLSAGVPWAAFASSMTLLDSHDTARFRTVAGDVGRHIVGLALLLTYPGVPMVFAGDEVGVEGSDSDQGRKPFPWDDNGWDRRLLDACTRLIALRRESAALQSGGLRWVHAGDDSLTLIRESPHERMLVHLARAAHPAVQVSAAALRVHDPVEPLFGTELLVPKGADLVLPSNGPAAHIWRLPPPSPLEGVIV